MPQPPFAGMRALPRGGYRGGGGERAAHLCSNLPVPTTSPKRLTYPHSSVNNHPAYNHDQHADILPCPASERPQAAFLFNSRCAMDALRTMVRRRHHPLRQQRGRRKIRLDFNDLHPSPMISALLTPGFVIVCVALIVALALVWHGLR